MDSYSEDTKPAFRACSLCAHRCSSEHGFDAAKAPDAHITRPPCFLSTSVEAQKSWMPIPKEFVDVHGDKIRGSVKLEGPNGKVWIVHVKGAAGAVGFKDGWKGFVADNNLKRGDQLLFSLFAKNSFYVYVFNRLGVETTPSSATSAKPALPPSNKRKRQVPKVEEVSVESGGGVASDSSEYDASESESDSFSDAEHAQGSSQPKREKLDNEPKAASNGDGSAQRRAIPNPSHKKKPPALGATKKESSQEPGWNSTTYESRRRAVSDAERDRTMEAAQNLKTKNPSVVVLMKPSHVYRGFWLTIPGKYSKEHMPQERIQIKLRDAHGFEWPASWIRSEHHSGVSGGWAAFSRDHCMEEGDVCVFEVVDAHDWTVLVHIFRVVPVALVPGSRGGWESTYNVVYGDKRAQGRAHKTKATKKTSGTAVKKNLAKALYAAKGRSARDGSGGAGEVPAKNGAAHNAGADEVDVKPKIGSLGITPKPAAVRVKQEAGTFGGRDGVGDVKPTSEQLRASLRPPPPPRDPICDLFQHFEEKPKIHFGPAAVVEPEPVKGEAGGPAPPVMDTRTWYEVVRLINKRQSGAKLEKEFLVELEGPVVRRNPPSSCAVEDGGGGTWWVPYSQFSPDFARCFID